jgi:hypothetical protein
MNKTKSKRLSQSQQKHVRRLKQTVRRTGTAYSASRLGVSNISTTRTILIVLVRVTLNALAVFGHHHLPDCARYFFRDVYLLSPNVTMITRAKELP